MNHKDIGLARDMEVMCSDHPTFLHSVMMQMQTREHAWSKSGQNASYQKTDGFCSSVVW